MIGKKKQSWFDANQLQYPNLKVQTKFVWSKRKLGGALLCLPYASLRGFYVSSGDTLGRFCR